MIRVEVMVTFLSVTLKLLFYLLIFRLCQDNNLIDIQEGSYDLLNSRGGSS